MYKTGMRVGTLANLKEEHVDFNGELLRLSGEIVKIENLYYCPLMRLSLNFSLYW